jgi:hypothetical protein
VSCSVYDAVRLERRGIPTAVVGTVPFVDEALEQARVLGMPDYRIVTIEHPVQIASSDELLARADLVLPTIVSRLTMRER